MKTSKRISKSTSNIETIARLTEEQIEDRDNVHGELIAFLNHWWTDHILEADQKYTKTFNIHGLH